MVPIMCRHFRAAKGYTSTFSHSIVRISFHASSAENNRPSSSLRHDPISWIRRFNAGPFRFPFRFILPSALHEESNMKGLARGSNASPSIASAPFDYALYRELTVRSENYNRSLSRTL